jgi:hypothetical protein
MKEIGDIIKEALSGVVDVYPQIADFESEENLPYPFAVYRVDEVGARTKEGESQATHTVSVAVVDNQYDELTEITDAVKEAILTRRTRTMGIRYNGTTTDYDEDDRAYIADLSFTIKKY